MPLKNSMIRIGPTLIPLGEEDIRDLVAEKNAEPLKKVPVMPEEGDAISKEKRLGLKPGVFKNAFDISSLLINLIDQPCN